MHFTSPIFHIFFNLPSRVKKIIIHPNQVLKFFNVAHLLRKSVLFYGNRPTCDAHGFLREILHEISLKKSILFFFRKKKFVGVSSATSCMDHGDVSPPLGWPNGVAEPPRRPNGGGWSLPNGSFGGFGHPSNFFLEKKIKLFRDILERFSHGWVYL
jgi:hypothetical protein